MTPQDRYWLIVILVTSTAAIAFASIWPMQTFAFLLNMIVLHLAQLRAGR